MSDEETVTPAPAEFLGTDLRGARFVGADLSGAVLRGVDVQATEIEAPWLFDGSGVLLVNGVDVVPLVEAELDRRHPGRAERRAGDPEGLRSAWAALERTWAATLARVEAMPAGTVDVSVGGEWSFAQTLRHLVMATDTWLGRAILEREQPYHPLGQPNADYAADGHDPSVFSTTLPAYDEVLAVRAGRVAQVRDYLATVTPDQLAATRSNPWAPAYDETVLSCLHVILGEEWEHHRYAVRDLDALETGDRPAPAGSAAAPTVPSELSPANERDALTACLDQQRDALVRKVRGVSDHDARLAPTASTLSLLGLLKHCTVWEDRWFLAVVAGRPLPSGWPEQRPSSPDDDFRVGEEDTVESCVAAYEEACARSRQVVAAASLDDPCVRTDVVEANLRWVLLHLVEETARHAGHADLLRETIDGTTGM